MRDLRGRFVSERPKVPEWIMIIICVLIGIILVIGTRHLTSDDSWTTSDGKRHWPVHFNGYFIDGEKVSEKTWTREGLLNQNYDFASQAARDYKFKCQQAWTILHDDPRDGRKAFRVLDE